MPRHSMDPLSEQRQQLEKEQERIQREMAEAKRAIHRKAKSPRPKPAIGPKVRLHTNAADSLVLPRPRDHIYGRGSDSQPTRRPRRRKKDARSAKVKFILLCLALATLRLFVWKNLPG